MGRIIGWIILIIIILSIISSWGSSPSYPDRYNDSNYYEESDYQEDYREERLPAGFEGTDTMNACNQDSGNCYDLDIDSDGQEIERINFPNGGWVDVDSSDCNDGYCEVTDENGTDWELEY